MSRRFVKNAARWNTERSVDTGGQTEERHEMKNDKPDLDNAAIERDKEALRELKHTGDTIEHLNAEYRQAAGGYDYREAEPYIAERTGQSPDAVREFTDARSQYMELNGQMDGVYFETDVEREAEKEAHIDLFLAGEGHEDQNAVLEYVRRKTTLSRTAIASMYAEEVSYEVTKGIMDADAYPYFRSWADAIAEEEQDTESSLPVN